LHFGTHQHENDELSRGGADKMDVDGDGNSESGFVDDKKYKQKSDVFQNEHWEENKDNESNIRPKVVFGDDNYKYEEELNSLRIPYGQISVEVLKSLLNKHNGDLDKVQEDKEFQNL